MYYVVDEEEQDGSPSKSSYKLGWFAGFEENIGNVMYCKIFTAETYKIIPRSRIISAAKDFPVRLTDSQEHNIEMGSNMFPISSYSLKSRNRT